jgi:predicted metal-dependent phosphoesterase TrpH
MRCDLHVHTVHSGLCNIPVISAFCLESYSQPEAVYSKLKRRGMSLVTITDHDSIGSVEDLRRHPDFFVSEEVTCTLPGGSEMHVGVYDINDPQHIEIQRRRHDFESLIAYLREQNLFFSANHIFSSLTGRRTAQDFECFENRFDAFEVLNGCMLQVTNHSATEFAAKCGKVAIGGSDAHTLSTTGCCWTEVPGARNKAEFFAGLRQGRATVHGNQGSYLKLTRDIVEIGLAMVTSNPLTAPVALLGGFVPLITLINYIREKQFASRWSCLLDKVDSRETSICEVAA